MGDAINLTVSNGDGPSVVIGSTASVSAIVATPDSSTAISVSANSTPSISLNTNAGVGISVLSNNSVVSKINELNNSITVASAIQSPRAITLGDLTDVSGSPLSQQVLVYNSATNSFVFADQFGVVSGSQNINAGVTVTNTDSAFDTIFNQTYEAGTSVTSILSQILNPYVEATLTFNILSYNDETASIGGALATSVEVEVGSNVVLQGINFSTTNPTQIQEGTIKLLQNNAAFGSLEGFAEEGVQANFSDIGLNPYALEYDTPTTIVFKLTAIDVGSSEIGTTYSIASSTKSMSWKYKALLCTSPTLLVSGADSDFFDIMNAIGSQNVRDDVAFDTSGAFDLVTGTASDEAGKYTYIAYPKSLGLITSIVYDNFNITGDFTFIDEFTYVNAGSLSQSYYIYRSNQAQFAGPGWKLEITTS